MQNLMNTENTWTEAVSITKPRGVKLHVSSEYEKIPDIQIAWYYFNQNRKYFG